MDHQKRLDALIRDNINRITTAVDELYAAQDLPAIRAEQGRLGGLIRRITSEARVYLTEKLIGQVGIESTQTVAKKVMLETFGRAASTAHLSANFAEPGRGAEKKFVEEAMLKLQSKRDVVDLYKVDYEKFSVKLSLKLAAIKTARK